MFATIFLTVTVIAVALTLYYIFKTGCPPMPSSRKAMQGIVQVIDPNFSGQLVELGSGFGLLAFKLAREFPCAQIKAYEISLVPYAIARICQKLGRHSNLTFVNQDFFAAHMSDATIIVCYLVPDIMQKLKLKLKEEARPGTMVISNWFSFYGEKAEKVYRLNDLYQSPIYVYRL